MLAPAHLNNRRGNSEGQPSQYFLSSPTRWGRILYKDYFAGENFRAGDGGFCQPWESQSSNCLTHNLTRRPMLRSEA